VLGFSLGVVNHLSIDHLALYSVGSVLALFSGSLALALRSAWYFLVNRETQPSSEWLEHFDFSRYLILNQLLHPQDFDFLARQPGYTPALGARLKSERLKITGMYLRQLEIDARYLLNLASYHASASMADERDFSAMLLKTEFHFAATMTMLRCKLKLMRFGLLRRVDFTPLIEIIRPLALPNSDLASLAR
jgi:hypothetical protein